MSADGAIGAIINLAKNLEAHLRNGDVIMSDARVLDSKIREAEGWLLACRQYLDPSSPLSKLQASESAEQSPVTSELPSEETEEVSSDQ